MLRMLRKVVCFGLLLSGLRYHQSVVYSQEPATMNGAPAVRFEQSPGFYSYVVFCKTTKEFTAQMPPAKLAPDSAEYGLCWYVSGWTKAGGAANGAEGKIVVSEHHVRFLPRDPQSASLYVDLPREQAELKTQPGQPDATLQGKGMVFHFRFSKLCANCAPDTPSPPGFTPALLDQEFSLLDTSIHSFYPAWRHIYQISAGKGGETQSPNQAAKSAPPAGAHRERGAKSLAKTDAAPNPSVPVEAQAEAPPPPRTEGAAAANQNSAAPSKSAASAVAKPATGAGVRSALSGPATPFAVPNSAVTAAVKPLAPGPMFVPKMKPVKIASGAADGLLVKKVPPDYPLEAKLVRLEGTVVLHAIIDREGEVSQVNAISGPPLLESAAVDAVKQWQYRPYSMNGQPVDVETTVEVVFALDGSHATRAQSARK